MEQNKKPIVAHNKVFFSNFKYISIATPFALIIVFLWFFNRTHSNETLFNSYFFKDRGLDSSTNSTNQYAFNDAMVDYKYGKYDEAIKKWTILLNKKPKNDTLNYFLGVVHLINKNEMKAINYLKIASEIPKSMFTNEANFYLGLSYLKIKKNNFAKKYFKQSNIPESKDILSELKN